MKDRRTFVVPALAIATLLVLGGGAHVFAAGNGGPAPPDPEVLVPVTYGTTYGGPTENVIYQNSLGSLTRWRLDRRILGDRSCDDYDHGHRQRLPRRLLPALQRHRSSLLVTRAHVGRNDASGSHRQQSRRPVLQRIMGRDGYDLQHPDLHGDCRQRDDLLCAGRRSLRRDGGSSGRALLWRRF